MRMENVSKFKLDWPHNWGAGSGSYARPQPESMTESLLLRIIEQGACLQWENDLEARREDAILSHSRSCTITYLCRGHDC